MNNIKEDKNKEDMVKENVQEKDTLQSASFKLGTQDLTQDSVQDLPQDSDGLLDPNGESKTPGTEKNKEKQTPKEEKSSEIKPKAPSTKKPLPSKLEKQETDKLSDLNDESKTSGLQEKVEKQIPKEEEPSKAKKEAPSTVVQGAGINLIPTMSEEEIKTADRKKKINLSSLISLSLLFSISILVIGFNIISRIQLNAQKSKINEQERTIQGYSQLISGNTEILERIFLYEDIQKDRFSTKLVFDYFQDIVSKTGRSSLNDFSFPGTHSFDFSGEAQNLEDVAKLWYLLSNDPNITKLELKTVSKSKEGARFAFTGSLNTEKFTGLSEF
jgi:hypothetical protein